jgi:hypothetical protein
MRIVPPFTWDQIDRNGHGTLSSTILYRDVRPREFEAPEGT